MNGFLAIVQVSQSTLYRHEKEVGNSFSCETYDTQRSSVKQGSTSRQTKVASEFLPRHSEIHGMPCPSGRGSLEEIPLQRLPSTTVSQDVYEAYCHQWGHILPSAMEPGSRVKPPETPLALKSFKKTWRETFPRLKLSCAGSWFCDNCHSLRAALETVELSDKVHLELSLKTHKNEATSEYLPYQSTTTQCRTDPSGDLTHVVFYFAEKVLLPTYRRQPGCLHFTTGLRMDLFGGSSSNLRTNFVFALPEGHWPYSKTADAVLSILSYVLQILKGSELTKNARYLRLHADNCSGQNKNRFVLFFLFFLVWVSLTMFHGRRVYEKRMR